MENLDGPGSEEWTFRESSHSQSVRIQYVLTQIMSFSLALDEKVLKVSKSQEDHYNEMRKLCI